MTIKEGFLTDFDKSRNEFYFIFGSLTEASGYPYQPKKINFLYDREKYKSLCDSIWLSKESISIKNVPIIINALELLYYENGDFYALYDNVTLDDVKKVLDDLKQLYEEYLKSETLD
jgi:hypothetical protein